MLPVDARAESVPLRSFDLRLVIAVWLSLLVYGAVAAPLPAVNEPHYLCKSKHFWQPEWCAGDFFLESPNAHTVFYATVGGLTRWLSLAPTAWIARAVATLVLAIGWVSLTARLLSARWSPLSACWMFLACASCGNLSGEWLVGGVEGKVFSYGLLFAACGQVLRGRIVPAGALAGLALSFHPVVGAWGVLAFAGAGFGNFGFAIFDFGLKTKAGPRSQSAIQNPKSKILSLLLLLLLSLPGLIPVAQLLLESAPAATKYSATYIQVYYRLAHHLDPMLFPLRAYAGYVVLLALWMFFSRGGNQTAEGRLFHRIVGWSVLFACAGLLIGGGPRPPHLMPYFAERMHLLKFYPFRLADVLVPLATSIAAVGWWERRVGPAGPNAEVASETVSGVANDAEPGGSRPPLRKRKKTGLTPAVGLCALLFVLALGRAHSVAEVNRYSGELRADWLDACRWIDGHLPADALVQAPHNGWAFKWFAGRAEYVAFKDCPQDAAGIVEWNRRLLFLKKWYEDQYVDQFYSADELRGLRRETGITHLLTDRLGPLELEPVYRNETFQVYDLSSLD